MNIQTTSNGTKSTMCLVGRFDFNAHKVFRETYQQLLDDKAQEIILDLNKVDYLDSSALGMLLQFKEKADMQNTKIALHNCSQLAQDVLAIANFDKLFEIS